MMQIQKRKNLGIILLKYEEIIKLLVEKWVKKEIHDLEDSLYEIGKFENRATRCEGNFESILSHIASQRNGLTL